MDAVWNDGTSGDWLNGANWSTGVAPTSSNTSASLAGSSSETVTLSNGELSSVDVGALSISDPNATFVLNNGWLNDWSFSTSSGTISLQGGLLINKYGFDNEGLITVSSNPSATYSWSTFGVAPAGYGSTINNGLIDITAGATLFLSGAWGSDYPQGTLTGTGTVRIGDQATFDIGNAVDAQTITFTGGTGTLEFELGHFTGDLLGLTIGDTIDFRLRPVTSASLNGSTINVVHSDGSTEALNLAAPLPNAASLQVVDDGHGGSNVVVAPPLFLPSPSLSFSTGSDTAEGVAYENNIGGVTHVPGYYVVLQDGGVATQYTTGGTFIEEAPPAYIRTISTDSSGAIFAQGSYDPYDILTMYSFLNLRGAALLYGGVSNNSHVVFDQSLNAFIDNEGGVVTEWNLGGQQIATVTLQGYQSPGAGHDRIASYNGDWFTEDANGDLLEYDTAGHLLSTQAIPHPSGTVLSSDGFSISNGMIFFSAETLGSTPTYTEYGYELIPPPAPANLADSSIANGYVNAAHDTVSQALTGTAQPASTITVYDGTTKLGTTIAAADGAWSYTLGTLTDGAHSLTATATVTDGSSYTGPASSALNFTVDATAPNAPSGLADSSIVDTTVVGIASPWVNGAHNTATQVVTGTAEAGSTVTVYDGTTQLGTTSTAADGTWSYTLGVLASGPHSLTATATDAAGNVGPASTALNFSVDTIWNDGTSGNWLTGGNWSNGIAPVNWSTNVSISGNAAETVTLSNGQSAGVPIGTLSMTNPNATLVINNGWLEDYGFSTLSAGTISLQSGYLVNKAGFDNESVILASGTSSNPSVFSIVAWNVGSNINNGLIEVSPGSTLFLSNSYGSNNARGTLTGTGTLQIDDHATLELGNCNVGQSVTFSTGAGTLELDGREQFSGTLVGARAGDTVDFRADAVTSASLSGTTITVAHLGDWTETINLAAPLPVGDSIMVSDDGHSGSNVVIMSVGGLADASISNGYVNAAHNTAGQALTGTAQAGSTVIIYDGTTKLGTTTSSATGTWSYTLGTLTNGTHSLTATATDSNGYTGPASNALTFTVDTVAPDAPTRLGENGFGFVYVDPSQNTADQALSGKAEVGSTVTVYSGGVAIGTTTADVNGNWSYTLGVLSPGRHQYVATATDAAGNTSAVSDYAIVDVDDVWTGGTGNWATASNWLSGAVPTQLMNVSVIGTTSETITVSTAQEVGRLTMSDPNATLVITGSLSDYASGLSLNSGTISLQNGLLSNLNDFHNQGLITASGSSVLGLAKPEEGTSVNNGVIEVTSGSTLFVSNSYGSQPNPGTLTGTGTVQIDDHAMLELGNSIVGQNVTFTTGTGTLELDAGHFTGNLVGVMAGDSIDFRVRPVSTASLSGSAITVVHADGTTETINLAAALPVGDSLLVSGDGHGGSNVVIMSVGGLADGSIANGYVNAAHDTAAQALTGTAQAGSTVTVYDGTTKLGTATSAADGTWSYTLGVLANGTHSLTATATDSNGYTGPASNALSFTVDPLAPNAPTGLADSSIVNGWVNGAHDTASQALTGTAEAGSTVIVYDGTTQLGTTTAAANGTWSYTLGTLASGGHNLTATATDAAGNVSPASSAIKFTVDTTPPAAPQGLADAADANGFVYIGGNTATQALTGTAEAGSTLVIFDGATKLGSTTVGSTGSWSFTLGSLVDGAHSFTAVATDAAGNTGASSTALNFTVDTHSVAVGTGLGFSLGDASHYALIAFNPHNFQGSSNSPIYGDVGVGPYNSIQLAGDTIHGNLITTGAAPATTGGTVTGSITANNSQLSADIAGLKTLSQTLAAESGTSLTLQSGSMINATQGRLDTHGNYVFSVTNWADNLTISGSSSQYVVINVPTNVVMKLDNVALTGGITADHVLFNYLGTTELHGVSSETFHGTVLDLYAKVNVSGVTLDGHLFGGAAGQDFQWVSGAQAHDTFLGF